MKSTSPQPVREGPPGRPDPRELAALIQAAVEAVVNAYWADHPETTSTDVAAAVEMMLTIAEEKRQELKAALEKG